MGTTTHLMFGPLPKWLSEGLFGASDEGHNSALVRVLLSVDADEALELGEGGRTAQAMWCDGVDVRSLGRVGVFRALQRARVGYEVSEWPQLPQRQEAIGRQISWRPGMSRELVRLSDAHEGITITESIYRRLMTASHAEGAIGDYFLPQIAPLDATAPGALPAPALQRYGRLIAALGNIGLAWR